jgi:hypothetical protein
MSWREDKGNGILWECQYEMIGLNCDYFMDVKHRCENFLEKYETHKGNEEAAGENFSLDNMTGILCFAKKFNLMGIIKRFPLFGYHSLRPSNFFFYLYVKYPWIGIFFLWIPSLAMIVSCARKYKYRNGQKMIATDGKILAWMRCKACNLKLTGKICTELIQLHEFESWKDVFDFYHGERFKDIPKENYKL